MSPDEILLVNATVCDVETAALTHDQSILIAGDRIVEVGSAIESSTAHRIDVGGRTVTPGLIDCHVHVTAASADLAAQTEWSANYVAAYASRTLRDMLDRGFTTVRDVGGADYGLAAAVEDGLFEGPRVIFGGKALSQTGGHADMRSRGRHEHMDHFCAPTLGMVCDGVADVRRAAREQLRLGAHHIKIMLSGGVASPTDRIDSTQFSDEEIRAVVEEAQACNRYVTGHAYTARAVNRGLELGVRCIEHGNLIDDRSVELFRSHDAFLVPTLVAYEYLAKEGTEAGLPMDQLDKLGVVLESGLDALRRAAEGGVSIAFGTDLLGALHRHQSQEFRIRAQVQEPADILKSATTTAAKLLNMQGEIGVLTPGAYADLLVVDGDPLIDATVFANPQDHLRLVMSRGRVVSTDLP
jgi:imidazolonepropionase-like amidohydrolase